MERGTGLIITHSSPYHDVSFQKLGRLQGDAHTASVGRTDVAATKNNGEVSQAEPEFGSNQGDLQKAVTPN